MIRPPLGRRADFNIEGNLHLRGDGLLLAGWFHKSGSVYVFDSNNSGLAWVESNGGGQFRVTADKETNKLVNGLWYEGVYREYLRNTGVDRSAVNAISSGR